MFNKGFVQLTDAERARKFDIAIRSQTCNILNAEQIKVLTQSVSLNRQYIIAVHPVKRDSCDAQVINNVIHIYIPEHLYLHEGE